MEKNLIKKWKTSLLPQTKIKELPEFVWNSLLKNCAAVALLLLCSIALGVSFKNGFLVAVVVGAAFVLSITYYFGWYLPFANNKVLWYDIVVISCMTDRNTSSDKAKAIFNRYIRKIYTVEQINCEDGITFQVVLKDSVNVKRGDCLRIYTIKEAIITKLGGDYLINNVLYTERI